MNRIFFLFTWLFLLVILLNLFMPINIHAEGVTVRGQFTFTTSDNKTTTRSTGESIRSKLYEYDQLYDLQLSKTIYPYLTFQSGAHFEWDNTTSKSEGTKTDVDEKLLRPFARLTLSNPIYQASVEYRTNQREEKITGQPKTEDYIDTLETFLGWKPLDLPSLTLHYTQTHTHDHPETIDQMVKLLTLNTDYVAWQELGLHYVYTRQDTENRKANFDTLEQNHLGRVEYSHNFLNNRLFLNTNYRIRYNLLKVPQSGTQEVALQRFRGLSIVNDNPAQGPLDLNDALIDGNVVVSAGIDIGLAGDETRFTNIGLDFGLPVQVDQVRIWVDRSLTPEVADSFSWNVYTSPDNTANSTWTLVSTVFPADLDTLRNRLDINFPQVTTRFIKVVTTPLSPAVSGAINFPNIFVTEMQGFVTASGEEHNEFTTIEQNYDLNLTSRISENTRVGYNLNFTSRDQDPTNQNTTLLSNDLFLSHVFNRIFSTSARVSRSDQDTNNKKTTEYDYSAVLRGAYLPTFDQSLSFSASSFKEEDDSSDNFAIFLRNNARLYPGWSMFVDSGFTWNRPLASNEVEKDLVLRAGTNFVPNNKFNLDMTYRISKPLESNQDTESQYELGAFYVPFRSLSLNANVRYIDQIGVNNWYQNYLLTWSPFPDGDLQFFFNCTQTLSSSTNQKQTTIGPGLNWSVGNHFFLEMFYNVLRSKSDTQKLESNSFYANLRMIF